MEENIYIVDAKDGNSTNRITGGKHRQERHLLLERDLQFEHDEHRQESNEKALQV